MANVGFKGIDVLQTGTALVFRAFFLDTTGAILASGTTTLRLYELQSDGTIKSYDFSDNTFKTTALTTATLSLTHRTGNNGTVNTGLWTAALSTLTGFTVGSIYFAAVNNVLGGPADQVREFQYGSEQGDYVVGSIPAFAADTNGGLPVLSVSGTTLAYTVSTLTTYTGNTPQTGDSFARIGSAGAGLTALGDTRLANLDAAVSTRSTYAGGDTSGTTTLLARLTSTRAGLLDNLDAAISTRSTYAGGDTPGTTTLLTRIPGTITADGSGFTALGDARLAHLDADVSTRLATSGYTAPLSAAGTRTALGMAGANLDAQLATIDADVLTRLASSSYAAPPSAAAISTQVASDLATAHGAGDWTTATGFATSDALASVASDVTAAKAVTDKLDTAMEADGPVYRFTTNALEQAPTGGGGGGGEADPYLAARIYGDVSAPDAQGRQTFYAPPNADDPGVAKVRLSPTTPRGGRTVELDP